MAVFWFSKQIGYRTAYFSNEYSKFILMGLLSDFRLSSSSKIYLRRLFDKFTKFSSVSYFKRSCLFTGNSRSVLQRFKLVRHQIKFYGSKGSISGLRKSSF